MKFSGRYGVGYGLDRLRNQRSFSRVRASERYLVLEFSVNLNQGCSGMGTASHTSFL